MIVNRVGDLGIAVGMFTMIYSYGSLDFPTLFSLTDFFTSDYMFVNVVTGTQSLHTVTIISVLLLIGAIGKSAQLGLHT